MNNLYETLLHSNTINFIIVVIVIAIICYFLNISEKIEKLQKNIENYVKNSEQEKEHAELELKNTEEKIDKLPEDLADIKLSAENNIKNFEQKLQRETTLKKIDIKNNAERILNLEIKTFKEKLTGTLTEASINLAEQNAKEQLKNNIELHNKYIDEAIDEIHRISL